MKNMSRRITALGAMLATVVLLSSCAALSNFGQQINQAFNGVEATMTTFDANGAPIDKVNGTSFRVSRDERFDGKNSEGSSKEDSAVLLISLGENHVSHVGSTMVLAQSGLTDVLKTTNQKVELTNVSRGTPFLNDLIEKHRNLWQGKAKTIMIRSQLGAPVAVFAGNSVEMFPTDVPKATWFQVDGKMLLVYRADYTVYDNALLAK